MNMKNKVLDLINKEVSDIKYTIHSFPDGHKHIELHEGFSKCNKIDITCRICNGDDLFVLHQIKDILSLSDIQIDTLYITYLFTTRADRRFSIGEAFDLKLVANSLKTINAKYITFLDLHSNILLKHLNIYVVKYALENFDFKQYRLCYPDEGACNRMYQGDRDKDILSYYTSGYFECNPPFVNLVNHNDKIMPITCFKHRESGSNQLSGFGIINEDNWKKQYTNKKIFQF